MSLGYDGNVYMLAVTRIGQSKQLIFEGLRRAVVCGAAATTAGESR
jgi:hypothetical protein